MNSFSPREHVPSILVATLSATFGVALLQGTDALARVIAADDMLGASAAVAIALASVAFVFIAIATYVGAIVTANTFATIIAGRTRTIALMRLVGASARSQRNAVAREGLPPFRSDVLEDHPDRGRPGGAAGVSRAAP